MKEFCNAPGVGLGLVWWDINNQHYFDRSLAKWTVLSKLAGVFPLRVIILPYYRESALKY